MEVNGIAKPLPVPESPGATLLRFDAAVHALGVTVVDSTYHRVEYPPKMLAQGF